MSYEEPPESLARDLVLSFFWRFSVFECALKREGFLQAGRGQGAQPDWTSFAEHVDGRFEEINRPAFHAAVVELKKHSPKRQVVEDGKLRWREIHQAEGESHESYVLRLLKTTRNNLFHGGKYPDGSVQEVAADRAILRAALEVLEGCYELHPRIARTAEEDRVT